MKAIENIGDFNRLTKQDLPVVLDFYADWCGPCQALLPVVEKLSGEYEGRIEMRKVNIDKNGEMAAQFEVRSIPALFFLKNSKIVGRINGLVPENIIREKLDMISK